MCRVRQPTQNAVKQGRDHSRFRRPAVRFISQQTIFQHTHSGLLHAYIHKTMRRGSQRNNTLSVKFKNNLWTAKWTIFVFFCQQEYNFLKINTKSMTWKTSNWSLSYNLWWWSRASCPRMSVDIIIRDKLWPMPKHCLMLLYVLRNRKTH